MDSIWQDQPAIPASSVFHLADKYTGRSSSDKIASLRSQFGTHKAWGFVASALDEIAWLFNLRGSDIPYNPVFFAYALITTTEVFLYTDKSRLTSEAVESLKGVNILPYDQVSTSLKLSHDLDFR